MAHARFHRQKRVHTRLRQQDRTQRPTRRNRGPSSLQTQHGFVLPAKFLLVRHAFIYIHFPVLCEPSLSATVLSQTLFHRVFQLLPQMAHVRFHRRKWVHTLGFRRRIAHNGLHAETGAFRMGVVSLPSTRTARSRTSPGRVSERQTLPLLGLGRGRS